jgi:sulfur carrier protein ThiS
MHIRLLKLGHSARIIDFPAGSTIGDALKEADLASEGHSIAINGLGASMTTALNDGDVLTLVPKVEGGVG